MPKKENSELELMCGLFRNEAKSGSTYYSGKHQKTGEEYVMFKNTYYEEGDNKFLPFALRKEGLYVLRYYKTEDGPDKAKVWENCPSGMNLFLWDREGNCVNGAY